jgi:hypothetical protein
MKKLALLALLWAASAFAQGLDYPSFAYDGNWARRPGQCRTGKDLMFCRDCTAKVHYCDNNGWFVLGTTAQGQTATGAVGGGGVGLTNLNGLTTDPQTFATGSAGSDFGISSLGSVHTFNIPDASASSRGFLSSTDWSTFNSKAPTNNPTFTGTVGGVTKGMVGLGNVENTALSTYTGAGGALDHVNLANKGTNTHAQIDSHISSTSNPHSVTKSQVGLGNVENTALTTWFPSPTTLGGVKSLTCTGNDKLNAIGTDGIPVCGTDQTAAGGTGDASTDTSTSVVNEVPLFKDTSGKLFKRATITGMAKMTSGVMSAGVAGTDYVVPAGNVATATALAANPADCPTDQFGNAIAANGDLTCAQVAFNQVSGAPTNLSQDGVTGQVSSAKSINSPYTTVTYGATPTFNAALGNAFKMTLTGNVSSSTLSNPKAGEIISFQICQDGSGLHTFVWPTNVVNPTAIDSTASGCTNQVFIYDGSNAVPLTPGFVTGVLGSAVALQGSSSGSVVLQPQAAASGTLSFPNGTDTLVGKATTDVLTNKSISGGQITSAVATATALAANGSNCSSNQFPKGVDASGAAESCAGLVVADLPSSTHPMWFSAATCNNATAGAAFDLPTSNAPTPTCYGTSYRFGTLDFADSANQSATFTYDLPTGWTGNIDADVRWFVNATSQSVKITIATVCVATSADILNPTFNAAQTVTTTSPGTANQLTSSAQTAVTTTGCSAGNHLVVKVGRDVTDTSTSTISIVGVQLVLRWTPQA